MLKEASEIGKRSAFFNFSVSAFQIISVYLKAAASSSLEFRASCLVLLFLPLSASLPTSTLRRPPTEKAAEPVAHFHAVASHGGCHRWRRTH